MWNCGTQKDTLNRITNIETTIMRPRSTDRWMEFLINGSSRYGDVWIGKLRLRQIKIKGGKDSSWLGLSEN